ncbi:MAG: protein phosphatase CheZ [Alphaproteobacteria bacterium]|nr:protein phosphatase CheZ [Alphaproteobacteria bacterium]MBP7758408.1 protein phosphatase CheZ [Alphaproteobacteria bacterium]MBP7762403.1 protein phosphatase CheZ [Alphaproteobacteria bacterium]MBP7905443.1 protein phosphatase CheZ [Alphaproteobacteria bacterium]
MLDKVEKAGGLTRESVFQELVDLKKVIEDSRREIGMARPGDIRTKDIPTATDELDAVVEATAQATATIMDACDGIQTAAGELGGDHANRINDEVMKIFEACSFQDITGQRIRKVVRTLTDIEERVGHLISLLGDKAAGTGDNEDKRVGDARLLNGPQLPPQAVSQDEIDKLLAELDGQ